jgi:hypothetical protein
VPRGSGLSPRFYITVTPHSNTFVVLYSVDYQTHFFLSPSGINQTMPHYHQHNNDVSMTIAEREAELAALQSAFDEYISSSRELEEELDAELGKMRTSYILYIYILYDYILTLLLLLFG